MFRSKLTAALAVLVTAVAGWGQVSREPHIGYVFPAGAQQGTTVHVVVGGEYLRGVKDLVIAGKGLHVTVGDYVRPFSRKEEGIIGRELGKLMRLRIQEEQAVAQGRATRRTARNRTAEMRAAEAKKAAEARKAEDAKRAAEAKKRTAGTDAKKAEKARSQEDDELPEHPWLRDLEEKSFMELEALRQKIFNPKKQRNAQIAEMIEADIKIDADAPVGDHQIRLAAPGGLTNPVTFKVSALPEVVVEQPVVLQPPTDGSRPELIALAAIMKPPPKKVYDLPVVLNGQVVPGDVEYLRFRAKEGQQLVINLEARRLVPYLADAVPGWFQAVMTLYDSKHNEVAFADDYRFEPDPIMFFKVPADGEYDLEIRDSIYRGREDFVYRASIGETPFITGVYPLGGREGAASKVTLTGYNLPATEVTLDTSRGHERTRSLQVKNELGSSNVVQYAVDTLPEVESKEPNDRPDQAQSITIPCVINGHIDRVNDVDVFRFDGRAGDVIVLDVNARRLGSPVDSLVRLMDASGKVIAWNDDHDNPESGLQTHHADSYVMTKLPATGSYTVSITDIQRQGGESYAYRLRVSQPQPDFALRLNPSSLNVPAGHSVPVWVHAVRKDGFDGDITLTLKDPASGFILGGGRIPPGRDMVRMTLGAPARVADPTVPLEMVGRAQIGGGTVTHPVVPADDMMQAFAYRHLVPSLAMVAMVNRRGANMPPILPVADTVVRIPSGGTAEVALRAPKRILDGGVRLELSEAPKGLTVASVHSTADGVGLVLKADESALKPGFADNLIVQVIYEAQGRRRVPIGILPAIPFEVVAK